MKQNNNHVLFTTLPFGIFLVLMGLWAVLNIPSAINKHDQIGIIASSIFGLLFIPRPRTCLRLHLQNEDLV